MAELITQLASGTEPVTLDDVAAQCRLEDDIKEALANHIESVIIPAARQLAEARSGSAIRFAKYRDTMITAPPGAFSLGMGYAASIDQLQIGGVDAPADAYELLWLDREQMVVPTAGAWGLTGRLSVLYTAGIDLANYPSVRQWVLLVCAWMLDHPNEELPGTFLDSLLWPIRVPVRV